MQPLVIVKTGCTFPVLAGRLDDFEHWVARGLGAIPLPVEVVDVTRGQALPMPGEVAGAVVTGSHAMVTDRALWSETLGDWMAWLVREEVPLLGICYGHQLLAHATGGEVGYRPAGIEVGTVEVRRTPAGASDPLLGTLPRTFKGQAVHRQGVLRLPPGAVLLAHNDAEPHHAFRLGRCAWGVQFHPEFGGAAMAGYIREMADGLAAEGLDPSGLLRKVAPTPEAAALLGRFGTIVEENAVARAATRVRGWKPTERGMERGEP